MKDNNVSIALLGPESSGKTTLYEQLCLHYDAKGIPEYARKYLNEHGIHYTRHDLDKIAAKQISICREMIDHSNQMVIYDTELINLQVWYERKYSNAPDFLIEAINVYKPDFYLLCYPDLTWEADPQRENKSTLLELFYEYEKKLVEYKFPFQIVDEAGAKRLQNAIHFVNIFLKNRN